MTVVCPTPGKRVYRSKRYARLIIRRHRGQNRIRIHAYRCAACGGWHVGHRPAWMTTEHHQSDDRAV